MKFNFRKIASALASTAMIGSTVALAAAANYPAPFVSNGAADVAIVYGNSLDLAAVTDVSTSLSSALASGSVASQASTEAYALFTSATPIQLNNSLNSVRTSVSGSSLSSVLGDVEFSGNVEATMQFKIVPGSNPRIIFAKEPTSNQDPSLGMFYGTTKATYLYNSTVTFDEAVNFTHTDSHGEELMLFGQAFTVSAATTTTKLVLFKSAETFSLSVGGPNPVPSKIIEIGGKTYTVELTAGTDDKATIQVTDADGKSDKKEISEAASKKILGIEVAVNTADESTSLGVQAEVVVGADRLTLSDGNEVKLGTDEKPIEGTEVDFETTAYPGNMTKLTIQTFAKDGSNDFFKVGNEFVDPVYASFRLVFDSMISDLDDSENRENIIIQSSGTDMASITFADYAGKTLNGWDWLNNKSDGRTGVFLGNANGWELEVAEQAQVNESGTVVLGNEDSGVLIEVTSITNATTGYADDSITLKNVISGATYTSKATSEGAGNVDLAGKSYAYKYFDNKQGDGSENVRFNYPDSSGQDMILFPTIETSKGANIAFYEPITINLTSWDGAGNAVSNFKLPDGDGYTELTVAFGGNGTAGQIWNITSGSTVYQVNTSAANLGGALSAPLGIGKLSYNFTSAGNANQTTVYLVDSSAAITRPAIVLFEDKDEADVYHTVIIETSGGGVTDNGVSVSEASFSWNSDADMKGNAYGSTGFQMESNDKNYQKLDQFGTLVTTDQSDSDQYNVKVSYPKLQATAKMYLDSLTGSSGATTLGDVKIMDDQLSSSGMSGKNLIVIGGSCVNTAASTLLGASAGCGSSWTAATGASSGDWIIQTFANPWGSSKVATLVAGWETSDTANAATYLTTKDVSTVVGSKLTGTTSTAATVVTA
ncbi:hypothetical protein EXS72_02415 [Candidatus Pacearchaeota archaeon]|nr:hypothetical protein [Candidatus Pacearchaeota archaeon]